MVSAITRRVPNASVSARRPWGQCAVTILLVEQLTPGSLETSGPGEQSSLKPPVLTAPPRSLEHFFDWSLVPAAPTTANKSLPQVRGHHSSKEPDVVVSLRTGNSTDIALVPSVDPHLWIARVQFLKKRGLVPDEFYCSVKHEVPLYYPPLDVRV